MSVKIVLLSETNGPYTEIWIESEVSRIGSDPHCQIRVEELPAHAATLLYRDGEYFLINRMDEPVRLGKESVEQGTQVLWGAKESLHLMDDVRLRLEIEGDPTPTPYMPEYSSADDDYESDEEWPEEEPEPTDEPEPEDPEESQSIAAAKLKQWVQMAVTGICVVLIVVILAAKGARQETESPQDLPKYSDVIAGLLTLEEGRAFPADVRLATQTARRHEKRNQGKQAVAQYGRALELLVLRASGHAPVAFDSQEETNAYTYLRYRLAELND